jgi:chorismate synthase
MAIGRVAAGAVTNAVLKEANIGFGQHNVIPACF